MSVLTMVVASPGLDKTAVVREKAAGQSSVVIRMDGEGEAANAILLQLGKTLPTGKPVVLDDALRTPKTRKPFLEMAQRFGYRTEAILLNEPLSALLPELLEAQRAGPDAMGAATAHPDLCGRV